MHTDAQRLADFAASGKAIPWAALRRARLKLAGEYAGVGFGTLAGRMRECGRRLEFQRFAVPDREHDLLHLAQASFCRARLCPGCQVRLARRQHYFLGELVAGYLDRRPECQALLLTLTVRSVTSNHLQAAVGLLIGAFRKLIRRKRVAAAVTAWYRILEVTRNELTGEFHAHFHVLLFVPPEYFRRQSRLYIDQAAHEWTALWRAALGSDYEPVVDIRRVSGIGNGPLSESGRSALAEVTKYVTKPGLMAALSGETLREVHHALKGRRLVGMSRTLRALAGDLGLADPEEDDTDMPSAMKLPAGAIYLGREIYEWHDGVADYVLRFRIQPKGGGDDVIRNE